MKGQSRSSLRYSVFGFVQTRIKKTPKLFSCVFSLSQSQQPCLYLHHFLCHLNTNLLHLKYAMISSYLADR